MELRRAKLFEVLELRAIADDAEADLGVVGPRRQRSVHEKVHLLARDQPTDEEHPYPSATAGRHRQGRTEWFHNCIADHGHSVRGIVIFGTSHLGFLVINE